jgi:hypothetical protein
MTSRYSRLIGLTAAVLFAATTPLLAQDPDDEHAGHHPETEAAGTAPPAAEAAPPAGMMGQGMMMRPETMQPAGGERGPVAEGMMSQGMMAPGMMHGMMEGMMRGMAEGLARGLVEGMAAVHGMEPEIAPARDMGPRAMRQPDMMRGRGMGPALLYGPAAEGITVERARIMLEGVLAWHGNPRLKLGTVEEQNGSTIVAEILTVDDSLVQKLAIDRATGAFRRGD